MANEPVNPNVAANKPVAPAPATKEQKEVANHNKVMSNVPAKIEVERNSTKVPFVKTEVKRGDYKGMQYLAPSDEITTEQLMKFIGLDVVNKWIDAKFKTICQGLNDEAMESNEATGEPIKFDTEEFAKLAAALSVRAESIKYLVEQKDDLVNNQLLNAKTLEDYKRITTEIRDLQEAIEKKRRPRSEKVEQPVLA